MTNINNENINNHINSINNIYEEILELNNHIQNTNFVSINDLSKIKQTHENYNQLDKLKLELTDKISNQHNREEKTQISIIREKIQQLERTKDTDNWTKQINQVYKHLLSNPTNIHLNKNIIIL